MPDHSKILILSAARPRRKAGDSSYTDFCPRPRFVRILALLLRMLGYKFTTLTDALAGPAGKYVCLTFDGSSRDIHRTLFPQLRALHVPATVFVATQTLEHEKGLKWADLRQLVKHGWEVGSLAHEPVDLAQRGSLDQRHLIARSRQLITAHLGAPPRAFAYPFGAYDATTLSCLRDEGFASAVTMRPGVNSLLDGEPLQLKRVSLTSSSLRDLATVLRHTLTTRSAPRLAGRDLIQSSVAEGAAPAQSMPL